MREFIEVRIGIEPPAAALAAENATAEEKKLLKSKLEKMRDAMNGDFDLVAADIAFHATILQISHNRFYQQLIPIVETAVRFSIRLSHKAKSVRTDHDAHERIYRAIKNGNCESASRACRELIAESLVQVVRNGRGRG